MIELLNKIKTMRFNENNIPRVLEIIDKFTIIPEEFHFVFDHLPSQFLKESEVCKQTFTNLEIKGVVLNYLLYYYY